MMNASMFSEALEAAGSYADDLPVNVNRFGHADIVNGLHALLHTERPPSRIRDSIRICHADGSESARFPLVQFGAVPEWPTSVRPLRVGFVSGRHPELDRVVDLYLLRNSEIRQFDTGADLEQEVFERAGRLLDEATKAGYAAVEALHTGLETVTVGFYRAVVEQARARNRNRAPDVLLRPRIWSPPRVNIGALVAEAKGQIHKKPLEEALERLSAETPAFLRLERKQTDKDITLLFHWLPERPMFASESDWLARRSGVAKPVVDSLYRRAQYRDGAVWVVR